jgi:triosephosphate isomerase (TIM)
MRNKIVAGNWKMNKTFPEAEELLNELYEALESVELGSVQVILCVPFPYLELAVDFADDSSFMVGAQNVHDHDSGAYTGEVSAAMLKSLGVDFSIIGHSERRKYFNESHAFLKSKVDTALKHGLGPIFCCGEVLPEREAGKHFEVVKSQLEESLFHLTPENFRQAIIAYEPVWAIGTGVNATPEQAQEMHAAIRSWIREKYGEEIAADTSILYGGSCNATNAKELFSQTDVDGGLIGGASLKGEEFLQIIKAALLPFAAL